MSAKFLHTFADENPDLRRHIGCMPGILQMFDRQHLLIGRRLNGNAHKNHSPGHVPTNSNSIGAEKNGCAPHIVLDRSLSKSLHENQRTSTESSRTSFSSSSCSSFSSLDCNKSSQEEHSTIDRIFYTEKYAKGSPRLKNCEVDAKTVCCEAHSDLSIPPIQSDQRSLDFRDAVGSKRKDAQSRSVRTSPGDQAKNHQLRQKDSPRPMQLSKSMDGSQMTGTDGRSRVHIDLDESLRVLAKLKKAPHYFSEVNEATRKSFEANYTTFHLVPKEFPRFSYDGRDLRPSLNPRETSKISSKLRELPRLSLDSREGYLKSSKFELKHNTTVKDNDSSSINNRRADMTLAQQQELESQKPLPSVVAKLMGFEPIRNSSQEQLILADTSIKKSETFDRQKNLNSISKRSSTNQDSKEDQLSCSQKYSNKDPTTLRRRKPDSIIQPLSHSRVPIEPAPWRHHDKTHIAQKIKFGSREAQTQKRLSHSRLPIESVYSVIDKKFKELEFGKSNRDLRALKHIMDAMHAKGLLATNKVEGQPVEALLNKLESIDAQKTCVSHPSLKKGNKVQKAFESPIVIMKPAKYVNRLDTSTSSVLPFDGLSGLQRLKLDKKKTAISNKLYNDQTPKASNRELSSQRLFSSEKKYNQEENGMHKTHVKVSQVSPRFQEAPREDNGSSVKTSNSISPRLQQINKPPKQPAKNKYSSESASPRDSLRRRPSQAQQNAEQCADVSSRKRSLKHQVDTISSSSDGNVSLKSQVDTEVRNSGCQSPSSRASKRDSHIMNQKNKKSHNSKENNLDMDLATAAPEQKSPVSVIYASLYQDDLPPVKITSNAVRDDETEASVDFCTSTRMSCAPLPQLSSRFPPKKLENMDHLIQMLRQLSSSDDKALPTDHISLLCETQSPDHRYVSEILLASGLLMKDLICLPMSTMPIQLQPSSHPINPDLFLVLEQTKSGSLLKPGTVNTISDKLKSDADKLQRKLVFDIVNELLAHKMEMGSPRPDRLLRVKVVKLPGGQRLLKELCSDIEHLRAESRAKLDDSLVHGESLLQQSEEWNYSYKELGGIILEIERLMFKDLIDEIVNGEDTSVLETKACRRQTGRC